MASETNAEFAVEATGVDLQFQWQKFGDTLCGGERYYIDDKTNSSTLRIQRVNKRDEGCYNCLVWNPVENSEKRSSNAELKVCKFL